MRIVIDARMLFWTGVGRYTKALLSELEKIDHTNEYLVLVRKADFHLWEPGAANFKRIEANANPYSLGEQLGLNQQLRALKPDLVHFTAPNTPLLYRGRRVVTVHDLTLLDYDTSRGAGLTKSLRRLKRLPFRLVFWNNARFATRLVTVTDYVKRQLAERFGVEDKRVATTLLAVDAQIATPEPIGRLGDLGTYVFYVGNVYPYKNVGSTVRALAELRHSHPDVILVVAGKKDSFTHDLERLAKDLGIEGAVKFVGFVSDGEMISLYRGAALYVNPSLSEGFGLQGLEAMAQNTPVISARASCLPEVYGEAAEYFEAEDPNDQAAAMARVLDDKALADGLRARGRERIKQFSWRRMAEETLEVYTKTAK